MRIESALLLGGVLLLPPSLCCQTLSQTFYSKMWKGTVRFDYSRKASFSSRGSDDKRKSSQSNCSSTITACANIAVCKTSPARWTSMEYQRNSNSHSEWTDGSKPCTKDIKKPSDVYFPVSAGYSDKTETGNLAEEVTVVPPEVYLLVQSDGSYHLSAAGRIPFRITSTEQTKSKDGCWGTEKSSSLRDEPAGPGQQWKRMMADGKQLLNVKYSSRGFALPLAVAFDGQVSGTKISGKLPLISRHDPSAAKDDQCGMMHGAKITSRSFSEDLVAEWDFELFDACSEVEQDFLSTWALWQAYQNEQLLQKALWEGMSGAGYDKLVGKAAASERAKSSGGGNWGAEDELATSSSCTIPGEQEWIDKKRQECTPEVIIDAGLQHERTHVKQCTANRARFTRAGPQEYHDYENEAYTVGLRVLLNWLEKNCPNFNAQPYRAKLSQSFSQPSQKRTGRRR